MRIRLVAVLLAFGLFSLMGSLTVGELNRAVERELTWQASLHEIERVRASILNSFWAVQKDLLDLRRERPRSLDEIIVGVESLESNAAKCRTCHHSAPVLQRFEELERLIVYYKQTLSYYMTASANAARTARLAIEAASISEAIIDRVDHLSNLANRRSEVSRAASVARIEDQVSHVRHTLWALAGLGLGVVLWFYVSLARPLTRLRVRAHRLVLGEDEELSFQGPAELAGIDAELLELARRARAAAAPAPPPVDGAPTQMARDADACEMLAATPAGEGDIMTPARCEGPVGQGQQVLIVEDEMMIGHMAEEVLARCRYAPLLTRSGEEALEAVYDGAAANVAAVILDLGLPGMDGRECLSRLRRLAPEVKIIVATGETGEGVDGELRSLGAAGYLTKPYTAEALLAELQRVLA